MIAQVHISGSFGDALDYVMNPKKEAVQKMSPTAEKSSPQSEKEVVVLETAVQAAASPLENHKQKITEKPLCETYQPSLFDDYPEEAKETRREVREPVAGKSITAENARSEKAPTYDDGARHRIIGGNLGGQTAEELTKEFKAVVAQRPDIAKPVVSISLSVAEGEKVSVEKWREIGGKVVEQLGLKDSPWVLIQHRDRPHDHPHIIASSVDIHGKKVNMWQCKQRTEEAVREIEIEHNLTQVAPSRETLRAAPKRNETAMLEHGNRKSIKLTLQDRVDEALNSAPDVAAFVEKLKADDVRVIPFFESQRDLKRKPETKALELREAITPEPDKVVGVCFALGDEIMKGSNLGRGFSWNALQSRGLDYQPGRDEQLLREIKAETETYLENKRAAASAISARQATPAETVSISETAETISIVQNVPQSQAEQVCRATAPDAEKVAESLTAEIVSEPLINQNTPLPEKIAPARRNIPETSAQFIIGEADHIDFTFDSSEITENTEQFTIPLPSKDIEIDEGFAIQTGNAVQIYGEETDLSDEEPLPPKPANNSYSLTAMQISAGNSTEPEQLPETMPEVQWQPTASAADDYFDDWYYLEYEKLIHAQIKEGDDRFQAEMLKQQEETKINYKQSVDQVLQNFQLAEVGLSAQTENSAKMQTYEPPPLAVGQCLNSPDYPPAVLDNVSLPSEAEIHARLALAVGIEPETENENLAAEDCKIDEKENSLRQNHEQSSTRKIDDDRHEEEQQKVKTLARSPVPRLVLEL